MPPGRPSLPAASHVAERAQELPAASHVAERAPDVITSAEPRAGVVLCFGDSLTTGTAGPDWSYPNILEALLRGAGHDFAVHNGGVWGDTASQLLARWDRTSAEASAKGPLLYVLVLGGTNDILRETGNATQIVNQLRQIHELAGRSSSRVAVCTLPPIQKSMHSWESTRLTINSSLRRTCAGR